jgi:hypothetical protein
MKKEPDKPVYDSEERSFQFAKDVRIIRAKSQPSPNLFYTIECKSIQNHF